MQSQAVIKKWERKLLLQICYKVWQKFITKCVRYYKVRQLLKNMTVCYYKLCQVLQSATIISKWDVIPLLKATAWELC